MKYHKFTPKVRQYIREKADKLPPVPYIDENNGKMFIPKMADQRIMNGVNVLDNLPRQLTKGKDINVPIIAAVADLKARMFNFKTKLYE